MARYIGVLIIAILALIFLAGCGESKIIATQTTSIDILGEYITTVEMFFAGDSISTIKTTITLQDEEMANMIAENSEGEELTFTQDGKNIYSEMSVQEYNEKYGEDFSSKSKKEIKEELIKQGYTIIEE